jgi:putative salt-induced outer membrane protein YdiY
MSRKTLVSCATLALLISGNVFAQDAAPDTTQPDPALAELESRVESAKAQTSEAQGILDAAKGELNAAQAALDEAVPLNLRLTEGWDFDAQVGLNGSTGNTEKLNYRASVNGFRETDRLATSLSLQYSYQNSEGVKTQNRFVAEGKNDWKIEDSKWRVFGNLKYEYDEFQDWDQRYSGFLGLGYELVKNDKHELIGRFGLGGNQTVGGADEGFTPEGFLGLDYTWKIKAGQSFKAGTTVFPSFDDLSQFRANNYAEYQIVLSEESGMILTTGAEHRFDSEPGTAKHNELDYYMTLGWQF